MLDPRIVDQIVTAWTADECHPHRGRSVRALPPPDALLEFLDTVFLATLMDEEGRQARFSVGLVMDEDLNDRRVLTNLVPLQLAVPPTFSPGSLVKLAVAFSPELTTIIVKWNPELHDFTYWGVAFHSENPNRFTHVPVFVAGIATVRPDYFTAIAKGRGAIAIARGGSLIGTLQAGYFAAATPTPFTSTSLGQYVHAAVQKDPLFAIYGNEYWLCARDAFELLLSESALRGHGGTIVVLPSCLARTSGLYANKYQLAGSYGLRQILDQCIRHRRSIEESFGYGRVANEIIQRIAQLVAIDGALLITFDFEVVAFGATLIAPRSQSQAIIGPDGFGQITNTLFEINRYGTRHRSAFDFVAAQSEAIAFVISQDGPIRAFRRQTDTTVYVWPDCTASMFV